MSLTTGVLYGSELFIWIRVVSEHVFFGVCVCGWLKALALFLLLSFIFPYSQPFPSHVTILAGYPVLFCLVCNNNLLLL